MRVASACSAASNRSSRRADRALLPTSCAPPDPSMSQPVHDQAAEVEMTSEQRAQIERECERIAVRSSDCMDAGRLDEFASFHTADTEFIRPSTWPGQPIVGLDALIRQ